MLLPELQLRHKVVGVAEAIEKSPVPQEHELELLLVDNRANLSVAGVESDKLEEIFSRSLLVISLLILFIILLLVVERGVKALDLVEALVLLLIDRVGT